MNAHMEPTWQTRQKQENRIRSGSGWLYAIAVFTGINSFIYFSKLAEVHFIIGLGITQIIEYLSGTFDESLASGSLPIVSIIGLLVNVFILATFVVFGYFARRKFKAAFIVGGVVYFLDTILLVLVEDYLGVIFHIWGLAAIFIGFQALATLTASTDGSQVDLVSSAVAQGEVVSWSGGKLIAFWSMSTVLVILMLVLGIGIAALIFL